MIEVSHLTKMYGIRPAIQDLSFSVSKGEVVGFLGPNGAGKSTTMKILTAFMPATHGKAKVAGYDVYENPVEVKQRVGYLPEVPPVYLEMQVVDYLKFVAQIHGLDNTQIQSSTTKVIDKISLGDVKNRIIGNLSKGYRQRVGLAQALIHDPDVLILDEPTVGLDPKQIIEIRNVIKELAGDHTVILSSHILPEVTATCQRVIVINKGKIVAQGSIDELTSRAAKGMVYSLTAQSLSQKTIDSIRGIPGVQSLKNDGNKAMIEIDPAAGEIRNQIVDTAVQSGSGVLEFKSEKLSLEDVFLDLTTEEEHVKGASE